MCHSLNATEKKTVNGNKKIKRIIHGWSTKICNENYLYLIHTDGSSCRTSRVRKPKHNIKVHSWSEISRKGLTDLQSN